MGSLSSPRSSIGSHRTSIPRARIFPQYSSSSSTLTGAGSFSSFTLKCVMHARMSPFLDPISVNVLPFVSRSK